MKKRLLALLLVIVMAASLAAGCSTGDGGASGDTGGDAGQSYTIAYSTIADAIAPFTARIKTFLQEKTTAKGWIFNSLAAEGDVGLQAEQVASLIAQKPDLLAIFPGDPEMAIDYCKAAYDAGIPVILICNGTTDENQADYCTGLVASDMYGISYEQMKRIIDKHGADAGLNLVIISGVEAQIDYQLKLAGAQAAIADAGANYNIIGPAYCESSRDKAQSSMETYLQTYGDGIDVVLGFDDDLTMGAINAIEAAGKTGEIEVYSQMGMNEMLQAIKDGKAVETLYLGADVITDAAVEAMEKYFNGEDFDFEISHEVPVINASNVDNYEGDF